MLDPVAGPQELYCAEQEVYELLTNLDYNIDSRVSLYYL